jgi:hypothetical protein
LPSRLQFSHGFILFQTYLFRAYSKTDYSVAICLLEPWYQLYLLHFRFFRALIGAPHCKSDHQSDYYGCQYQYHFYSPFLHLIIIITTNIVTPDASKTSIKLIFFHPPFSFYLSAYHILFAMTPSSLRFLKNAYIRTNP